MFTSLSRKRMKTFPWPLPMILLITRCFGTRKDFLSPTSLTHTQNLRRRNFPAPCPCPVPDAVLTPSQAHPVQVLTWWTSKCKKRLNLNWPTFMPTMPMAWGLLKTQLQSALEVSALMKDHQRTLIAARFATMPTHPPATFTDTMSRPICKGTPIHVRFATRNSAVKTTWPLIWEQCTVGAQGANQIPLDLEATVSRWRQIFLVFLHWCQARVVHVYLHLTIIKNICHLFKIKFPMNKLHNMREQAIIILLQQKILFKAVCALCIRCNNTWLLFVLGNLYSKSELPRLLFIIIGQLWFKYIADLKIYKGL